VTSSIPAVETGKFRPISKDIWVVIRAGTEEDRGRILLRFSVTPCSGGSGKLLREKSLLLEADVGPYPVVEDSRSLLFPERRLTMFELSPLRVPSPRPCSNIIFSAAMLLSS
jgi:hypothetical protein